MRARMNRGNRAKQFMPFSALKGYEEALRREEKVRASQIELMEDYEEELDRKLQQIQPGDVITVTYYRNHEYQSVAGVVEKLNKSSRFLMIDETKIFFDRIYRIVL